jgi:hypothetical protein
MGGGSKIKEIELERLYDYADRLEVMLKIYGHLTEEDLIEERVKRLGRENLKLERASRKI